MAKMLMKSAGWSFGCDCSVCRPIRERQAAMQAARQREERLWRRDQAS